MILCVYIYIYIYIYVFVYFISYDVCLSAHLSFSLVPPQEWPQEGAALAEEGERALERVPAMYPADPTIHIYVYIYIYIYI